MVQDRMTAARLETSQELTKDLKNAIVYGFQKQICLNQTLHFLKNMFLIAFPLSVPKLGM